MQQPSWRIWRSPPRMHKVFCTTKRSDSVATWYDYSAAFSHIYGELNDVQCWKDGTRVLASLIWTFNASVRLMERNTPKYRSVIRYWEIIWVRQHIRRSRRRYWTILSPTRRSSMPRYLTESQERIWPCCKLEFCYFLPDRNLILQVYGRNLSDRSATEESVLHLRHSQNSPLSATDSATFGSGQCDPRVLICTGVDLRESLNSCLTDAMIKTGHDAINVCEIIYYIYGFTWVLE